MPGEFLTCSPEWPFPEVKAFTFFAEKTDGTPVSFRLNTAEGSACRKELEALISPYHPIVWLNQVHGDDVLELDADSVESLPSADASFTKARQVVCAVFTADCVPLVYCNPRAKTVAAVHAGRRGIEQNLPVKMLSRTGDPVDTYVWIGPGIASKSYPISAPMRTYFLELYPGWVEVFEASGPDQYKMDLYAVVRKQLRAAGVPDSHISGGEWDTFTNPLLHSARRDAAQSGRMATVVWME